MASMSVYLNAEDQGRAKAYAAASGRSVSGLVTDAVRRHLRFLELQTAAGSGSGIGNIFTRQLGNDKPAMLSDLDDLKGAIEKRLDVIESRLDTTVSSTLAGIQVRIKRCEESVSKTMGDIQRGATNT